MKVKKSLLRAYFVLFLILFLLCQKIFLQYSSLQFLSYVDEIACLVMLLYIFIHYKTLVKIINKNKTSKLINICFVSFMIIGLFSSIIYRKISLTGTMIDIFSCARFYIVYLFSAEYFIREKIDFKNRKVNNLLVVISIILFLITLLDLILKIYPRFDIRMGLESLQLFFIHPSQMSIFCIALTSLLLMNVNYYPSNKVIIALLAFVNFWSLRTATIAYILLIFSFMIILQKKNTSVFSKKLLFGMIAIIALYFGFDQFSYYYSSANMGVRNIMTRDALKIALSVFPLGYGFGAFGTFAAVDYKSLVYVETGYYSIYNFTSFACDSFVSSAFGQFGLIGGTCLLLILISWLFKSIKIQNKYCFISALGLAFYFLISIFASTDIFNPNFLPLVMIFSIIVEGNDQNNFRERN